VNEGYVTGTFLNILTDYLDFSHEAPIINAVRVLRHSVVEYLRLYSTSDLHNIISRALMFPRHAKYVDARKSTFNNVGSNQTANFTLIFASCGTIFRNT
jgi:hypothetical protein